MLMLPSLMLRIGLKCIDDMLLLFSCESREAAIVGSVSSIMEEGIHELCIKLW